MIYAILMAPNLKHMPIAFHISKLLFFISMGLAVFATWYCITPSLTTSNTWTGDRAEA